MATTEHPCTSHTWSSSNPAPMPALLHWQTRHPGTASMGRRALLPLSCLCPALVLPCVPAFPACQGDTDQGKSPWHWVLASSALCCGSSTHASTSQGGKRRIRAPKSPQCKLHPTTATRTPCRCSLPAAPLPAFHQGSPVCLFFSRSPCLKNIQNILTVYSILFLLTLYE